MTICASCGQDNPEGFKFCGACGAALEAAVPAREERKVVTVLFADLVGFTSRAEQMDPEDVRALLAPYHAHLRSELERYGGTVEKFIGDAVMALFGAPVAHEDDPERAVRAALAIRDWRFGSTDSLFWLNFQRRAQHFWRGNWNEALSLAEELIAGERHYSQRIAYAIRSSIRLARGDVAGAVEDAGRTGANRSRGERPPGPASGPLRVRSRLPFRRAGHRRRTARKMRRSPSSRCETKEDRCSFT